MNIDDICRLRDQLDNLVNAYPQVLRPLYNGCKSVGSLDEVSKIRAEFAERSKDEGRPLHIGIVGRVKAGKSTLLNSLFFGGKSILPTAPTPMTAAITKMYYSDDYELKVHFFSEQDIDEMREKYEEYESRYESLIPKKTEAQLNKVKKLNHGKELTPEQIEKAKDSACKSVKRELDSQISLAGAHDQYALVLEYQKSHGNLNLSQLPQPEKPSSFDDIKNVLGDFVGADGEYTALTSYVEIGAPIDGIRDMVIVDTPGYNDPVSSRDTLARESLKVCDAVFVLSPADNFANNEDVENISKIDNCDGIKEINIVISQIDHNLGCENINSSGDIKRELEDISIKLRGEFVRNILEGDSKNRINPDVIEKMKNDGNNMLFTSGVAHSMYLNWGNDSLWGKSENDLWSSLQDFYGQFNMFSQKDSRSHEMLRIIGNIEPIQNRIHKVNEDKEKILAENKLNYIKAKYNCVSNVVNELSDGIIAQIVSLDNAKQSDIDNEKAILDNINVLRNRFSQEFQKCIDSFSKGMSMELSKFVNNVYSQSGKSIDDSNSIRQEQKTVTKYRTEYREEETGGFWDGFFQGITLGLYKGRTDLVPYQVSYQAIETNTIHTINCHAVCSSIEKFSMNISSTLTNACAEYSQKFKQLISDRLMTIWKEMKLFEYSDSKALESQATAITRSFPEPEFEIDWSLPVDFERNGYLDDIDAEKYNQDANRLLTDLHSVCINSIEHYCQRIKTQLVPSEMAEIVLDDMKRKNAEMQSLISNKGQVISEYEAVKNEVFKFKMSIENVK